LARINSIAFGQRTVYVAAMKRIISLSSAILLLLLPDITFAASAHKKSYGRWHGYGFLPGYRQPVNNTIPVYGRNRGRPDYAPSYWWNGARYYYGDPGFYRSRYNGGSFGPCWTYTPIGLVWNCG
jgi:hypothetical protein